MAQDFAKKEIILGGADEEDPSVSKRRPHQNGSLGFFDAPSLRVRRIELRIPIPCPHHRGGRQSERFFESSFQHADHGNGREILQYGSEEQKQK